MHLKSKVLILASKTALRSQKKIHRRLQTPTTWPSSEKSWKNWKDKSLTSLKKVQNWLNKTWISQNLLIRKSLNSVWPVNQRKVIKRLSWLINFWLSSNSCCYRSIKRGQVLWALSEIIWVLRQTKRLLLAQLSWPQLGLKSLCMRGSQNKRRSNSWGRLTEAIRRIQWLLIATGHQT